MEDALRRLIDVYWRERELYRQVRGHVARQRELIEAGRSYAEINAELTRKRDLLEEIATLEGSVLADRELWQRRRHRLDGSLARSLMTLLAEVTGLVETLLEEERQNEILLTSRRRHGVSTAVNARHAAASYRNHSHLESK